MSDYAAKLIAYAIRYLALQIVRAAAIMKHGCRNPDELIENVIREEGKLG